MIHHVCPSCWGKHELSDDYYGIVYVCSRCNQTSEVIEKPIQQVILVEPSASPKKDGDWDFLFKEIRIFPPAQPMYTQVDLHCPYCKHHAPAILRYAGWNEAFSTFLSVTIGLPIICCTFGSALAKELGPVFLLIVLFFAFVALVAFAAMVKFGINAYQAHCQNCNYWFR
jgi:hypothetical protein